MKKDIKVLLVNTYDINGGAARSTFRLHKGLQKIGIDSKILVQVKSGDDFSVISPESRYLKLFGRLRPAIDSLPLKMYRNREEAPWGISWLPNDIIRRIDEVNPDIVHLNWISGGFVPVSAIPKINYPIVWTLHDSWAFTGGCHLPYDCTNYMHNCGYCPLLGSKKPHDLSRCTWNRKYRYWKDLDLTIITPGRWLYDRSKKSSLLKNKKIKIIPSGIVDTDLFKPIDKKMARKILNISEGKKYILYGAVNFIRDKNKGFKYLNSAVKRLASQGLAKDVELLIFGSSEPLKNSSFGIKTRYLGILYDDFTLALLYSAADITCIPSIQETFPMTAVESLSCGTPVIAFNSTGITDIIDHKKNGYLAEPFKTKDFADGINWVLESKSRYNKLSKNTRKKVIEKYRIDVVARKLKDLYESLINEYRSKN